MARAVGEETLRVCLQEEECGATRRAEKSWLLRMCELQKKKLKNSCQFMIMERIKMNSETPVSLVMKRIPMGT